jgi:hypothetical protein
MFDQPSPTRRASIATVRTVSAFGFGRGIFGQYIAEIVLLEAFRSLLALKGLRTINRRGVADGPAAAGLVVTFSGDRKPGG